MDKPQTNELRPGITNKALWYPERPPDAEWRKVRKIVLARDNDTCQFCGHSATKWMQVHHVDETSKNEPENLITCCVACHAVMHTGLNLQLGKIEIWKSEMSQLEIIRATRDGVKNGKSIKAINAGLPLKKGHLSPNDVQYANELLMKMGDKPRATLEKPLCAVFVDFKRWQV